MIDRDLIRKAETGDVDSIITLANAYYDGIDGEGNCYKAFELYSKALEAEPENVRAINCLGNCYNHGVGVDQDTKKAEELYRKAANIGDPFAQYNLARHLEKRNDSECLEWYEEAYKNGDVDAPLCKAIIFLEGKIVPEDRKKYIDYLIKADEIGNNGATLDLACAYLQGDLVEKSIDKGFELMQKAAAGGNKYAANNLSVMYEEGFGIEADTEKSIEWAKNAANLGDTERIFQLAVTYFYGDKSTPEDKSKAVEFFILAANAGSSTAMENLGICYSNGYGVEVDKNKSVEWLEKAAREGSREAIDNLKDLYAEVDPDNYATKYFELVRSIADDGYYYAMVKTHLCLRDGDGVDKNIEMAMSYLDKAFEDEYADACFIKGAYFFNGVFGLEKDRSKAVHLWEIAANKDHIQAAGALGECYRDGDGVEASKEKALEWFNKANELGSVTACFKLGLAYDKDGFADTNYAKAAEFYKEAFDNGYTDAGFNLGRLYEKGLGVVKDEKTAFWFYKSAADHGNPLGIAATGISLYFGTGTEKDEKLGIKYAEKAKAAGCDSVDSFLALVYSNIKSPDIDPQKAFEFNLKRAEAGDSEAQFHVYEAFFDGIGVEEDLNKANAWLKASADGGHVNSQAIFGLQRVLVHSDVSGIHYLEKASEAGHLHAMYELANIYLDGINGVTINKNRAIELYRRAAEAGSSKAQNALGLCYTTGNGVPKDDDEAFSWYSVAADQGEKFAMRNLAICYQNGEGTAVNKTLASYWFDKAAAQGDAFAKCALADIYAEGEGVIANDQRAEALYNEVIAMGEGEYYTQALHGLALLYSNKIKDHSKAFPLWRELAVRGNTSAKFNLGVYYFKGWGVTKDDVQAQYWWQQAADEGDKSAAKNLKLLKNGYKRLNNS